MFSQFEVSPFRYFLSTLLRHNVFCSFRSNHTGYIKSFVSISWVFRNKNIEFAWKLIVFSLLEVSPFFRYFLSTSFRHNFLALTDHITSEISKVSSRSHEYLATKLANLPGSRPWSASSKSRHFGISCQHRFALTFSLFQITPQVVYQKFRLNLMSI